MKLISVPLNKEIYTTVTPLGTETQMYLSIYDYVIPILGLTVICVNFFVIISSGLLIKKGIEPRFTYLFLGNMAVSDFISGLSLLVGQYYPKQYRNQQSCAIQMGLIITSTLSSAYSVGLLAIDRFLYIVYGLKYSKWLSVSKVKRLVLTTWTISVIIGFMPVTGWYGDTDNGRICWFITIAPHPLIIITVFIGLIPILTVLILYSIILYHAIKSINRIENSMKTINTVSESIDEPGQLRMFKGTTELHIQPPKSKRKNSNGPVPSKCKAVKIVMLTTFGFTITWAPFFITCVIFVVNECDMSDCRPLCRKLKLLIASPLSLLGFSNSLINPIIYAWWHNGFRTYVRENIKKICIYK